MMERGNRASGSVLMRAPSNLETENVDFRLHFQASRVPRPGWDKLVVSLISIDTGKTIKKTSRGLVRNGSCQWPEPIIARITQESTSKAYTEKLYKLVVQMGSLRTGILGEATINLTDYINIESPDTISLPLKNCAAGTVLHVKIQCLTPKNGPGEPVRQRTIRLDEDDASSVSESDQDSYSSGEMAEGSVRSSVPQSTNGHSYLPKSQRQFKAKRGMFALNTAETDGPVSIPTSRQESFDYSSSSSISNRGVRKDGLEEDYQTLSAFLPHKPSSIVSQESRHSLESFRSSFNDGASNIKGWQDTYAWQAECINPMLLLSPSSQKGTRVTPALSHKLDAAKATIRELKEEILTWERHADKLDVEAETLRQHLASELKSGAELRIRISSLLSENDSLKAELAQLRTPEVAPSKWEDVDDYSKSEFDKTKKMVKTLEEEITYEREVCASLHLQLQKTQDSNSELVSIVTELEGGLELRNKEISELVEIRKELENQLDKVQCSNVEGAWTAVGSKERAGYETNDDLSEVLDILRKEMQDENVDHNVDHNELTDANIELFQKLHKANRQLDANVKLIALLEASVEKLSSSEPLVKPRNTWDDKQDFVDALRMQVKEHRNQDYLDDLRMQVKKLGHQNNFLEGQLIEAKKEIASLVVESQFLEDQKGQSQARVNVLESQVPVLLEEIKLLGELQSSKLQLEMEKAEMQEKLCEAHDENRAANEKLNDLVGQMATLSTKLDAQLVAQSTLQSRILQLESEKGELKTQVAHLEEANIQLLERIADGEGELESEKEELQTQVVHLEEANIQLLERIANVEAELNCVLEERELLKADMETMHEKGLQELQENCQMKLGADEQRSEKADLLQTLFQEDKDCIFVQCVSDELFLKEEICSDNELIRHLRQQLQEAKIESSLVKEKCFFLEAEVAEHRREGYLQDQTNQARTSPLYRIGLDGSIKQHAYKADQLQNGCDVDILLSQGGSFQGLTERTINCGEDNLEEALSEATKLHTGQVELEHCIEYLKQNLIDAEDQMFVFLNKRSEDETVGQEEWKHFPQKSSQKTHLAETHSLKSSIPQSNEQAFSRLSPVLVEVKLQIGNMRNTVDQMCHVIGDLQQEKSNAVERLAQMTLKLDDLKQEKSLLIEKLSIFSSLIEAQDAGEIQDREHGDQLLCLRRHVSHIQQKLVKQEDNLDFKTQVGFLEEKLQEKVEALSRTEEQLRALETSRSSGRSSRESKEVLELRQQLKLLEERQAREEAQLTNSKLDFMHSQTELYDRIESLELSNEQLAAGPTLPVDSIDEQLKKELLRLQTQNSSLVRKEQELKSCLQMQQFLEEEVLKLQETNELLHARLVKFLETAADPLLLEKVVNLEAELAEAMDANNLYRLQLKGLLDKPENIDMDALKELIPNEMERLRSELTYYKKRTEDSDEKLKDMNERYTYMSLKLAETETNRGELLITIKKLRMGTTLD